VEDVVVDEEVVEHRGFILRDDFEGLVLLLIEETALLDEG
jgi:hypothetical protein